MQYFGGERPPLADISILLPLSEGACLIIRYFSSPPFPKNKNIPFSCADLQTEIKPGGAVGVTDTSFGKGGATPRAGLLSVRLTKQNRASPQQNPLTHVM